jgi:hypothetical protein
MWNSVFTCTIGVLVAPLDGFKSVAFFGADVRAHDHWDDAPSISRYMAGRPLASPAIETNGTSQLLSFLAVLG